MSLRTRISSRRTRSVGLPLLVTGLLLAVLPSLADPAGASTITSSASTVTSSTSASTGEHIACPSRVEGTFHCMSTWRKPAGAPTATVSKSAVSKSAVSKSAVSKSAVSKPTIGFVPADIQAAYKLPTTGGAGQTVAIVDAYDNPNVEKDLAAYRSAFGMTACTTANGCFTKVNQRGGSTAPEGDSGWGVEIDLDVQAVSASCPSCKILLVESDDSSLDSLGIAENEAVKLGAKVVSNSYGTDEFGGMSAYTAYYTHPGVPIVASSGDDGFTAAAFPAVLPTTWAVGGTELVKTPLTKTTSSYTETAWDYAGSGCSAYIAKQSWQKDTHCQMRTVADVSALASEDPGFAEYDTYGLGSDDGWITVGGTSISAPLIAGVIGLAHNETAATKSSYAYAHRSGLNDVVGGSNGYCGGDYLCTGVKGYDGPTGLGSPKGTSAF